MRASDWIQTIPGAPGPARERAIRDALLGGGIVQWPLAHVDVPFQGHTIGLVVANDLLSVGTEDDFVRVPMAGRTAQAVADALGFMLPTPKISDLIWLASDVTLTPIPRTDVTNTPAQMSTRTFAEHSDQIESQRAGRSGLVAGHKKDVVISNRLADHPDRVCIYGWHLPRGSSGCGNPATPGLCPIQGMSTIHEWSFSDYSHGVRPVSTMAFLDGQPTSLAELLRDKTMAWALSHEGPLRITRVPDSPGASFLPASMVTVVENIEPDQPVTAAAVKTQQVGGAAIALGGVVLAGLAAWRLL